VLGFDYGFQENSTPTIMPNLNFSPLWWTSLAHGLAARNIWVARSYLKPPDRCLADPTIDPSQPTFRLLFPPAMPVCQGCL
jgi:hypothetical protein